MTHRNPLKKRTKNEKSELNTNAGKEDHYRCPANCDENSAVTNTGDDECEKSLTVTKNYMPDGGHFAPAASGKM